MIAPLRRRIIRAAKSIDHRVGRLVSHSRVLVDVRTPMNLEVLRPVWARLASDPRVDIRFTAEPGTGIGDIASREGIAQSLISRDTASWTRFDLSMTADLWNRTPLYRCRRRINFFHGVAGKYDLDTPAKLARAELHEFDRIAFINADRMDRYLRAGIVTPEQAVLVGFPKGDELINGKWDAVSVRMSLGLPPSRETVLYAPTFSPANSLHLAGEAIVRALLGTGRNVIVKLHDRSMVPHPKYTEGIDWPGRLAAFNGERGFALARVADAGPVLAAADVLVTDHSTVGFEFALIDRPIVVYDAPALLEAARIDPGKWALLRSMADVVNTPETLVAAVELAFANPVRLREARRQAHNLFAHAGHATDRAVAAVYELLELEAVPAAVADAAAPHGRPEIAGMLDRRS